MNILNKQKISFIGAGNMGKAIIQGLIKKGFPNNNIIVMDKDINKLDEIKNNYSINTTTNYDNLFNDNTNILFLALKPDVVKEVIINNLSKNILLHKPILISVCAGIQVNSFKRWINIDDDNKNIKIIRAMPNTPSLINYGSIGLYSSIKLNDLDKNIIDSLFLSICNKDSIIWTEKENLLDIITSISGSSPAYFFYLVEFMIKKAVSLGLDFDSSVKLITTSLIGSGLMLKKDYENNKNKDFVKILRQNVTSKGGTTEAAINIFDKYEMNEIIMKAIEKACKKSKELGNEYK